jgi:hypothetical protein
MIPYKIFFLSTVAANSTLNDNYMAMAESLELD